MMKLKKPNFIFYVLLFNIFILKSQNPPVKFTEYASSEKVFGDSIKHHFLIPMNDFNMEAGYVLYETNINVNESKTEQLRIENVRDYAIVYLNGKFIGSLKYDNNSLNLSLSKGFNQISLYVENIGRVTYGPEVLSNDKGLFGKATLGNLDLLDWVIKPLLIFEVELQNLNFKPLGMVEPNSFQPGFFRGTYNISKVEDCYIDTSNWGTGEVWLNNNYLGSFTDRDSQKTISISSNDFIQGENIFIIFDINPESIPDLYIKDHPVFN